MKIKNNPNVTIRLICPPSKDAKKIINKDNDPTLINMLAKNP